MERDPARLPACVYQLLALPERSRATAVWTTSSSCVGRRAKLRQLLGELLYLSTDKLNIERIYPVCVL